ncbi:MAG: sigma-70 factor domain-containing protein, partial [Limisphaerales bacterium]
MAAKKPSQSLHLDDAEDSEIQDQEMHVSEDDTDIAHALRADDEDESTDFDEDQDAFEDTGVPRSVESGEAASAEPVRERYDGDTAFKLYLREIGQVALLTPEEEVALAVRIQQGDGEARDLMIKANLRLVVKIAHDYEGLGLPLLDLINEGNIGLMKAVERFDPTKGSKLSTY